MVVVWRLILNCSIKKAYGKVNACFIPLIPFENHLKLLHNSVFFFKLEIIFFFTDSDNFHWI
jgi:hypothetical protein